MQSVHDRIFYLQTRALTLSIQAAADPTNPYSQRDMLAAEACERLVAKLQEELNAR